MSVWLRLERKPRNYRREPLCDPTSLLQRAGWTTGELSRRLGVPASTVTSWARRGYWPEPVIDFLTILANAVESVPVPRRYRVDGGTLKRESPKT